MPGSFEVRCQGVNTRTLTLIDGDDVGGVEGLARARETSGFEEAEGQGKINGMSITAGRVLPHQASR